MNEQLIAMTLAYAPKALVALAMLAVGWFTARWISAVTAHKLERYGPGLLAVVARVLGSDA